MSGLPSYYDVSFDSEDIAEFSLPGEPVRVQAFSGQEAMETVCLKYNADCDPREAAWIRTKTVEECKEDFLKHFREHAMGLYEMTAYSFVFTVKNTLYQEPWTDSVQEAIWAAWEVTEKTHDTVWAAQGSSRGTGQNE